MEKLITMVLSCLAVAVQAQKIGQLKKDMYGIASGATEGRFTGFPGYLKAAHYVASQLKAAGLKTTFQAVPFVWNNYNGSTLTIDHKTYTHENGNFIVLKHSNEVAGKWVTLKQLPDSAQTASLIRQKAGGVILLPDKKQASDWETIVIRQYRFGYMHYAADFVRMNEQLNIIMICPDLAGKIQDGLSAIVNLKFRLNKINGYNLIVNIDGTDKVLKEQIITAGAHLDHLGRVGNRIYNGANDDASGCVALMAAARFFGKHPAKRPLMLIFYCGEELNLLGSRYLMEHPPVPIKNIRLNINLEQVGSKHRYFHGIWGLGDPQFQKDFFRLGRKYYEPDLRYSITDSVREVLSNTDSYSFMKKNVPCLLLGSGGFDEHHTASDTIKLIDFPHLEKASLLLCSLIKSLAY